jgi:predicted MPP superfamily phosphohydrolase
MMTALIWAGFQFRHMRDPARSFGIMLIMGLFLMLYVPKMLFNTAQLLGDGIQLLARLLSFKGGSIQRIILWTGAGTGLLLFTAFGMGILRGRTHVKVFRESIVLEGLPESFIGIKIVQISDLHLAGFYHQRDHIKKVVSRINQMEPDLILFTGDMVHNFSEEVDPFIGILGELEASIGKYAVLGNHDYGHYFNWESQEAERANLERVKAQIRAAGFDLLLNEFRTIRLNGETIELVGVENWGKPPFPQQGDLAAALVGTRPDQVKILMSHDPSHWDLQVEGKVPVQLTLSGHTHGMQFGLEIGRFRWSPSRWTYKHWGGLYQQNGQYLYVNRGLGFTGFPGRVGIRPEITLITLNDHESSSNLSSI